MSGSLYHWLYHSLYQHYTIHYTKFQCTVGTLTETKYKHSFSNTTKLRYHHVRFCDKTMSLVMFSMVYQLWKDTLILASWCKSISLVMFGDFDHNTLMYSEQWTGKNMSADMFSLDLHRWPIRAWLITDV